MELILNTDEINVAISFLLIHPPIFDSDANFHRLVQWIKEKFNQSQQSILLVAIYCNSSQLKLLNDFASNLIGYRLQLKGNSLNLSRLFQQVFPDDMLLNEYMRNLPITPKLNAKSFHQNSQIVQNMIRSRVLVTDVGVHGVSQLQRGKRFCAVSVLSKAVPLSVLRRF